MAATTLPPLVSPPLVSEEAYLAQERDPEVHTKSELLNGVVTMMPGGTPLHSNVGVRAVGLLLAHEIVGCEVFNGDMKVRIPGAGFLYPDASYACDPRFEGRDVLLNPLTVVEVLSPSTERRDRETKFEAYATIPSLIEIALVATDTRRVEVYRKDGDGWRVTFHGPGDTARLTPHDIPLPLDALYASFDRLRTPESPTS